MNDDDRLATRGEVRALRKEVKYWVVIGLIGGQAAVQIGLALLSSVVYMDVPQAMAIRILVSLAWTTGHLLGIAP